MSLEDLALIGEFLGGLAILISLIYLVLEVRKQSELNKATATSEWGRLFHGINWDLAKDPVTADLLSRSFRPGATREDFTEQENARFIYLARGIFAAWRVIYDLQSKGGIADDLYDVQVSAARGFIDIPIWREWWETDGKASLGEKFFYEIESRESRTSDNILDAFQTGAK